MTNALQNVPDRELEPRPKQELPREGTRPGWVFSPEVDIVETADAFHVAADLPGVGEDDVDVRLENGVLTLEARPSVLPDQAWQPLRAEYRLGGFRREFAMGDGIDVDGISARMRDGVLEIALPKTRHHRPRRIEVAQA